MWLEGKYVNRRDSGLLLPCTVSMRHYSKISYRYQNLKMLKSLIKNGLEYRLHPLRSVEAMETHSFQFKFRKRTPPKGSQDPTGYSGLSWPFLSFIKAFQCKHKICLPPFTKKKKKKEESLKTNGFMQRKQLRVKEYSEVFNEHNNECLCHNELMIKPLILISFLRSVSNTFLHSWTHKPRLHRCRN